MISAVATQPIIIVDLSTLPPKIQSAQTNNTNRRKTLCYTSLENYMKPILNMTSIILLFTKMK